jgi:ferredoxin, 2Fe-2S
VSGVVRVLPRGIDIEVADDESLLAAAQRLGIWWPTVCQGLCECGTCFFVVEEGAENLSPMGEQERQRLAVGMKAGDSGARLACQVRVHGPVTVSRRAVQKP